jgi:hypothetical protein
MSEARYALFLNHTISIENNLNRILIRSRNIHHKSMVPYKCNKKNCIMCHTFKQYHFNGLFCIDHYTFSIFNTNKWTNR